MAGVWRRVPPPDVVRGLLDRRVILDVELPAGSGNGPAIDRAELSRLRRVSAPLSVRTSRPIPSRGVRV